MVINFLTSWIKNEAVQVGGSDMVTNTYYVHWKEKYMNFKVNKKKGTCKSISI